MPRCNGWNPRGRWRKSTRKQQKKSSSAWCCFCSTIFEFCVKCSVPMGIKCSYKGDSFYVFFSPLFFHHASKRTGAVHFGKSEAHFSGGIREKIVSFIPGALFFFILVVCTGKQRLWLVNLMKSVSTRAFDCFPSTSWWNIQSAQWWNVHLKNARIVRYLNSQLGGGTDIIVCLLLPR